MSKFYELSISENYVHNWGKEEAIRELMQNAIDSETDGNELNISYTGGTLTITNFGVNLTPSSLVLGNTEKKDGNYIGKFGEGMKLAVLVLLREGLKIEILTNGEKWVPEFRESKIFGVDTLHFDIESVENANSEITIKIEGLDFDTFTDIRSRSIAMLNAMGHSIGKTIKSEYGDILMNTDYKGMMFVNGLYIQKDTTFKYGYNFKSEYVKLDRDRKALDYYKLRELTARAITSQNDMEIVNAALVSKSIDTRNIENVINDISDEFNTNFAKHFMETNKIDEGTFVGTKQEVLVSKEKNSLVVSNKVIAELVNRGSGKRAEYTKIKDKVKALSKKEEALEYYESSGFKELVELIGSLRDRLTDEEKELFIEIIENDNDISPYYFDRIIDDIIPNMFEEAGDE